MTDAEYQELADQALAAAVDGGGVTSVTVDGLSTSVDHKKLLDTIEQERVRKAGRNGGVWGMMRHRKAISQGGGGL